jgi:hypothetical protein
VGHITSEVRKWGGGGTHLAALDFYGHINNMVAPERRPRLTSMMDTPTARENTKRTAEEDASS